jgi:2-oxoisovalerate dehydrogenase E1 component beta subunit
MVRPRFLVVPLLGMTEEKARDDSVGRWRCAIAVKTVLEAVHDAMREEMARDERVFVMGEDVGRRGGVFLATEGFLGEFGEGRVIDTPLAESSIAGIALGAALNGMRPIAEIQFGDFIWPVFNQIVGEAARVRYGTNGRLGVPLVLRTPHGGGVRGALYHSQSVEAYFYHTPGLKVVTPATPYDAKGLLKSAIRDDDPVIFLEHKRTYRLVRGEIPDEEYTLPLGVADVKLQGEDMTVITYGLMVHHCLEAARELAQDDISVEVVDLRTLRPLDRDTILESVRKTGKALIVHEDNKAGGIGGEVAAIISEEAFDYLDSPVTRLAGPEVPAMPYSPPLEAMYMLDTAKIAKTMRRLAEY